MDLMQELFVDIYPVESLTLHRRAPLTLDILERGPDGFVVKFPKGHTITAMEAVEMKTKKITRYYISCDDEAAYLEFLAKGLDGLS